MLRRAALALACWASGVPLANMVTVAQYEAQLKAAGFESVCVEVLGKQQQGQQEDEEGKGRAAEAVGGERRLSRAITHGCSVFEGFAAFVPRQQRAWSRQVKPSAWRHARGAAAFCRWAARSKALLYVVASAAKPKEHRE